MRSQPPEDDPPAADPAPAAQPPTPVATGGPVAVGDRAIDKGLGLHARRLADALRSATVQTGVAAYLKRAPAARLLTELTLTASTGTAELREQAREAAAREAAARAAAEARLLHQIYVGATERPTTFSHLGWLGAEPLALARTGGQVIIAAGAQGTGKSQALLTMVETALAPRPPLTSVTLPPTAVLAFHCDLSGATLPELVHAAWPSRSAVDRALLAERMGVAPRGLPRVRLLVPRDSIELVSARVRAELGELPPNLEIRPLRLRPCHLGARGLAALLGVDPQHPPRYLQELLAQALALGPALSADALRRAILDSESLSGAQRARALARLGLLEALESDSNDDGDPWELCEPGVLSIVHLTGRWLSADHALPLIVALMNVFVQPSPRHGALQRVFVLDEINELRGSPELWAALVMTARQIRHLGSILWLSGQDLCNVPGELLGLATLMLCFRLRSPRVFHHLRRSVAGFGRVRFGRVSGLEPGHAILVAAECSRPELRGRPLSLYVRPPSCAHGGHTRATH